MELRMYNFDQLQNMDIEEVWGLYRKHVNPHQVELLGTFPFGREKVEKALGCWIYLENGKKILDLTGGIGVLNHGHNHPRILSVRKRFASENRMEVHKNFLSPYLAALSANVAELLPGDLNYSYFPNSGAEAVEGALKLAYKFHNGSRKYILHSDISFHGKLLGAASLTGSPEISFKFPQIPNVKKFIFDDIESVINLVNQLIQSTGESDIYAIIVEPLNASTMRSCSEDFLKELQVVCNENNIVLIFDEVYSGWGKTGTLFNFMRVEGLSPDIITYAKSFGGGKASISGYTCTSRIASAYQSLKDAPLHSTTYNGFGEETVTAIEALNILVDEKLVDNSRKIGEYFSTKIPELLASSDYLETVRGSGALWGLIMKSPSTEVLTKFAARIAKATKMVDDVITADPRFAKKLIVGSIVNSLYLDHGILTYFGVNVENPLIISFPLVATIEDAQYAVEALTSTLRRPLYYHILRFIWTRSKGPKSE